MILSGSSQLQQRNPPSPAAAAAAAAHYSGRRRRLFSGGILAAAAAAAKTAAAASAPFLSESLQGAPGAPHAAVPNNHDPAEYCGLNHALRPPAQTPEQPAAAAAKAAGPQQGDKCLPAYRGQCEGSPSNKAQAQIGPGPLEADVMRTTVCADRGRGAPVSSAAAAELSVAAKPSSRPAAAAAAVAAAVHSKAKAAKLGGPLSVLQLPLGAPKQQQKLLSPACCRLLDVAASPLSVISQASTSCALLSSASSLGSCSQPPTPHCGLLDSRGASPLPLSPDPSSPRALAAAAAEPRTLQGGPPGGPPCLGKRAIRGGESQQQPFAEPNPPHPGQLPAEAAAAAAGGQGASSCAGAEAAAVSGCGTAAAAAAAAANEETAAGTAFLSSAKTATAQAAAAAAAAAAAPLRLPIPTRGLRRLQNPRLQQHVSTSAAAAAPEDCGCSSSCSSSSQQQPRSQRRLQLPRLRIPLSPHTSACALRGKHDCMHLNQRHSAAAGPPSPAAAAECMYTPGIEAAGGVFVGAPAAAAAGECLSCGGGCGAHHQGPTPPSSPPGSGAPGAAGGPLGDAFEAAAHAAHVAAHAAARAAAHAAAHAAVLKRRAAEAYWCSRPLPEASKISIYPDMNRDIHRDYNLYCAAWPDGPSPREQIDPMDEDEEASQAAAEPAADSQAAAAAGHHLLLGEGRYGKVILAQHRRSGEMVAVKVLDKRRALADESWDCRQELEMHRRLPRHAHVVSVLDVYEDRKSLYILMELCDRNTLVDRIVSDGAFSEDRAKLIFAQLLSGVLHCHNNNIVHRDLKPENILFARSSASSSSSKQASPSRDSWSMAAAGRLSPVADSSSCSSSYPLYPSLRHRQQGGPQPQQADDSIVKITDFGSACFAVPGELSGTACGTIHYLAPEILAGNYYDGFLSDVWSLGVILYIIISATPPFYGESDGEVVQKIVAGSYSMSGYQWRHISDECKDIIRRLLTVDPRCRMRLNEAISHPWFLRATGGLSVWSPLSPLCCSRCGVEEGPFPAIADDDALSEAPCESSCCCGGCQDGHCEGLPLVWGAPCRFACCSASSAADFWISTHAGGYVDWPRN